MKTRKKHTEALLETSREVGLEVNPEKTKCMVVSLYQNTGQNHILLFASKPFENMANFKYFGTTVTKKYCIHENIKSRLNSENVCYHSVQSLLPSRLLSTDVKGKVVPVL
jgi:hypothetical protein